MIECPIMISVVVPLYNEEESLRSLFKELENELSRMKMSYEIIFVDDGSSDSSLEVLKSFEKKNKFVRIFSFRKNRGKSEALSYGFLKSRGEYIVTMDADLQDKPYEAKKLFNKLKEGYDHVSGWRKERKDTGFKIIFSKVFNVMLSNIFGLKIHDYNCGLKAYTQDAAKSLRLYGGLHRFIPLLLYQEGFKVTEVPISHNKRKYGKSKFGISKVWKDLPDMLTMIFLIKYSKRPLHFFGLIGFVFFSLGIGILSYLTIVKIFYGQGIGNRPVMFLGILLVISGFQVLLTGFLADLFINTLKTDINEYSIKYSSKN